MKQTEMKLHSKILESINQMSFGEERILRKDHPAYRQTYDVLLQLRDEGIDLKNNFYLVIEPDKFTKFETATYNYIKALENEQYRNKAI